jgi:hypothetical protein
VNAIRLIIAACPPKELEALFSLKNKDKNTVRALAKFMVKEKVEHADEILQLLTAAKNKQLTEKMQDLNAVIQEVAPHFTQESSQLVLAEIRSGRMSPSASGYNSEAEADSVIYPEDSRPASAAADESRETVTQIPLSGVSASAATLALPVPPPTLSDSESTQKSPASKF